MKRLVIVNGTMGAGKSAVCRELKKLLAPCAFLDGDWCWDMEPFIVNAVTKEMALKNISYLLDSFLCCPVYETVLFCWVLHQREVWEDILSRLTLEDVETRVFTLMLAPSSLRTHIEKDMAAGLRTPDVLERALSRLSLYESMNTEKVWVDKITPQEAAAQIAQSLFV